MKGPDRQAAITYNQTREPEPNPELHLQEKITEDNNKNFSLGVGQGLFLPIPFSHKTCIFPAHKNLLWVRILEIR